MSGAVILPSVRARITSGPATTMWYATGWPRFFSGRMTRPQLRKVMANAVPAETSFSSSTAGVALRSACSASASIDGLNESFVCSRSMNARGVRPLVSKSIGWARSARTAVSSFSVRPKRTCGAVTDVGAVGSELGEVVLQLSAVGSGERAAGEPQLVSSM